jgi:putative peptidoglycan lipid II flippase
MSWTGPGNEYGEGRHARRYDPDATMVMPIVPSDATVVLPLIQPTMATQAIPVPGAGGPPPPPGSPGGPGSGDEEGSGSVARNSAVMAVGSLVSRVTGAIRTIAIGAAIGAAGVSNAYNLANTLPNMVYELLLGGVLASVVVPLLVRARTRDTDRGEAYAQRLLTMATTFLAAATILAVLIAPLLTYLIAGSSPATDQHLITTFNYLLLPEIFFYGIAALLAAILNTRGHFAAPMWTPILNNVVVILTCGLFVLLPTASGGLTPQSVSTAQVQVLGVGTTLGIVIQAAGLFPALRKVGFRWRWRGQWRQLGLRELGRIGGWMLAYVVISQIALFIVLRLAQGASNHGGPGPAIWNNAYLIFMMAHGIVAVSIITALMPRMATAAAEHRYADVAAHLSLGTRLSAVILIPATAAYVILGRQLAVTLFKWGEYTQQQAVDTGWVIAAAGLGLVPFAISQLQIFAFYALPDTKTPALLNVPVAAVRIAIDLVLWAVLSATSLVAGLMIGNTISFVLACWVGYWLLRKRIGRLGLTKVLGTLSRLAVAALIAAVPTLLVTLILQHFLGLGKVGSMIELLAGGLVLIVVYLAAAVGLRVREINEVWSMVRGRLGR